MFLDKIFYEFSEEYKTNLPKLIKSDEVIHRLNYSRQKFKIWFFQLLMSGFLPGILILILKLILGENIAIIFSPIIITFCFFWAFKRYYQRDMELDRRRMKSISISTENIKEWLPIKYKYIFISSSFYNIVLPLFVFIFTLFYIDDLTLLSFLFGDLFIVVTLVGIPKIILWGMFGYMLPVSLIWLIISFKLLFFKTNI